MKLHPYFRVLPRIRLYVAKPMRAGCFARTTLLIIAALVLSCHHLAGQVDGVLHFKGQDAEFKVANPSSRPLQISITLFRDSTLTDSVPARISPQSFTLQVGQMQIVRIRLKQKYPAGAHYRLGTLFTPPEDKKATGMHFVLATRLITRAEAGP
jgi:P pilus assembly chaperone PapD